MGNIVISEAVKHSYVMSSLWRRTGFEKSTLEN